MCWCKTRQWHCDCWHGVSMWDYLNVMYTTASKVEWMLTSLDENVCSDRLTRCNLCNLSMVLYPFPSDQCQYSSDEYCNLQRLRMCSSCVRTCHGPIWLYSMFMYNMCQTRLQSSENYSVYDTASSWKLKNKIQHQYVVLSRISVYHTVHCVVYPQPNRFCDKKRRQNVKAT